MKYLKVEDNKGHFCLQPQVAEPAWKPIDEITKDDLMALLNQAVTGEFQMDEYVEDHLQNKAHQIIYKRIHEKFKELLSKKDIFNDDIENTYKTALEKYSMLQTESTIVAAPATAAILAVGPTGGPNK